MPTQSDAEPLPIRVYLAPSQQLTERGQLVLACKYKGKLASFFVVRLEGVVFGFFKSLCAHAFSLGLRAGQCD